MSELTIDLVVTAAALALALALFVIGAPPTQAGEARVAPAAHTQAGEAVR